MLVLLPKENSKNNKNGVLDFESEIFIIDFLEKAKLGVCQSSSRVWQKVKNGFCGQPKGNSTSNELN